MIIQLEKNGKTYQAYKEISINRTCIIDIYELITYNNSKSHKFIISKGTNLDFNNTSENDLIKLAKELIEPL